MLQLACIVLWLAGLWLALSDYNGNTVYTEMSDGLAVCICRTHLGEGGGETT